MVTRSLQMLDMYLSMYQYNAFGSILKQNGTCYNSPKIMDVTARYTIVSAAHANLVHPVSWRADKVAMVSVILWDVTLKIVLIGKIIKMQKYRGKITHVCVRIPHNNIVRYRDTQR